MGDVEAGADIVTAGLTARAVEPHAGEGAIGGDHGHCLNCGTALIGSHCHACGQSAHVHKTMGAIGHDLLHGVFHFEGKIWHTLPMLALKPGELTRRYIDGERARFVSPIALFLFSVFLMFAIVANLPGWHIGNDNWLKPGLSGGVAEARTKLATERVKADGVIGDTRASLAKARTAATPDAGRIDQLEQRLAKATRLRADLVRAESMLPATTASEADGSEKSGDDFASGLRDGFTQGGVKVEVKGTPEKRHWLERKWELVKENPKLTLYKIKTSAYKFSWALIPISLPFLWLLFPMRRDIGMYDHAIFATYSLTFMSLLTIVLAVLLAVGLPGWMAVLAAGIIPPLHMYRQLKGTYGLGRWGALWRLFWLLNITLIASTMFTLMLLYLGVAD